MGALSSSRRGIAELLSSTRGKLLEGEKLVIRDPEGRETQKIVLSEEPATAISCSDPRGIEIG